MAGKQKEMKFSVRMSPHDRGYRVKRIVEFLRKHNTVLLTVQLRGREASHPELAFALLESLIDELSKAGRPAGMHVHKGRILQSLILPK